MNRYKVYKDTTLTFLITRKQLETVINREEFSPTPFSFFWKSSSGFQADSTWYVEETKHSFFSVKSQEVKPNIFFLLWST